MNPRRRGSWASARRVALAAALGASAARRAGRALPPPVASAFIRTNHAGNAVTLLEGPVLVAGVLAGLAAADHDAATAAPAALAVVGAAAFGALDDHHGSTTIKGLRGHLGALRSGEVTSGAVKIIGMTASGLAGVWLADRRPSSRAAATSAVPYTAGTLAGGLAVAVCANVANLFDLRPGRALKVGALAAVPPAVARRSALAAAVLGAGLAVLPDDLAGKSMLGDTGANALGAGVGMALVLHRGLPTRVAVLGAGLALTLASEKVSFTRVIEANPVLNAVDQWGRRPGVRP